MSPAHLLPTAFLAVLAAEVVGDKTFVTLGSLATQHRAKPIAAGAAAAFAIKMLAAVTVGRLLATLPPLALRALTASSFFAIALAALRRRAATAPPRDAASSAPRAAALVFGVVLVSEWGDPGQLTAAALASRYGAPATVWLAGVAAMCSKGVVGFALGRALRARVRADVLQRAVLLVSLTAGVVALLIDP